MTPNQRVCVGSSRLLPANRLNDFFSHILVAFAFFFISIIVISTPRQFVDVCTSMGVLV